ncbi:MAG TPA: hypothetical protein VLH94_03810 [Spirochaetia bacterium]|nr:hypothetical protein [Spirochaetia bacterium]
MQMPVVVGVVVALIFLIAFSEWFYHLVIGWNEFVLDDMYFKYRMVGVSLLSIAIMSGTFYGLAMFYECPSEDREGVFAKLNCEDYTKIKAGTEKVLMKIEKSME